MATEAIDLATFAPDGENERTFVVLDEGHLGLRSGAELSRLIDLADIYGPVEIWTQARSGGLTAVRVGERERINTHEEFPFRYALSPLITEEGDVVGYVTHTDH